MNLGINLIEITLMALIELSQLLEKFFPASKTTSIRKEICGLRQ